MHRFSRFFLFLFISLFSSIIYAQPYGAMLCKDDQYDCYTAKKGDTWESVFGNAQNIDVVKRLNRVNIGIYPGMKIAVPKNLGSIDLMDIAPFARQIESPGKKIIFVSLKSLAWGAYDENGYLQFWGPISGGQNWCADVNRGCRTVTGAFVIYNKQGSECVSTKYPIPRGGAPMPYCMYFYKGFAMHGSPLVPGYHASHGCLRMFIEDARWLNQEFLTGTDSVPVIINYT